MPSSDSKKKNVEEKLFDVIEKCPTDGKPDLNTLSFETAVKAMAENSRHALYLDLQCFSTWCKKYKHIALPASPETLVYYLKDLTEEKSEYLGNKKPLKAASVRRRIASISTLHKIAGLSDDGSSPTKAPIVKNQLKIIGNQSASQKQAAPLRLGRNIPSHEEDQITVTQLLSVCEDHMQGIRDAALLSVGYDGGFRVSELTGIKIDDIVFKKDGTGEVNIPFSKTDQEGEGAKVWISATSVNHMRSWIDVSKITDGFLFRRVRKTMRKIEKGKPAKPFYTVGDGRLSRSAVNNIYKRLGRAAVEAGLTNIPKAQQEAAISAISSHSLRVGMTHDLFASGEDGTGITLALRWNNSETALGYARKLNVKNRAASRVIGAARDCAEND